MSKAIWLAGIVVFVVSAPLYAQLLNTNGEVRLDQTNVQAHAFAFTGGRMAINLSADTRPGTVTFEIQAPNGTQLGSQTGGGVFTMGKWELANAQSGTYTLRVTPHQTAGRWQVRIDSLASKGLLYQQAISGALMMLVALAGVLWWWRRSHVQWRWFWAGAGIWTGGVALKFAVALPLNPVFVGAAGHPARLGLTAGIVYCGLMTGIFEIGATLAAALIWRRLAAEPNRAVAVGLGAGSFEAMLLGLGAAVGSLIALAVGQTDQALQALGRLSATTPLLWLAGPVERLISMAAHTASRVLVLQAVAERTWLGFWAGFTWLSLVDLMAGVALLTGMTQSTSIWWIELMILPFGILSIPLARYALAHWPHPKPAPQGVATESAASADHQR